MGFNEDLKNNVLRDGDATVSVEKRVGAPNPDKKSTQQGFNMTENVDKVGSYTAPTWNGGSGAGSQSNIDRLAQDYLNSSYDSFTKGNDYASLAKRYSDQGRQAMDDTIGQMAARTGGLASSYATVAGQQAYGDWMGRLEDAARSLYDSQMAEKASKLGVAQGLYDRQYSQFQDDRNWGYQMYQDELDNAKYMDTAAYNQYQLDEAAEEKRESTNKQNAAEACQKIHNLLEVGTPLDEIDSELIASSGYDSTYWNLYNNAMHAGEEEEFTRYIYTGTQDDLGNNVFMYGAGGETFSFAQGVNPYTGSINPDVKNGTWSNGYQPNNINGEKLSKTGITDVVNGVTQNVWQTPDGTKWIWDGTQNKYLMYED